MPPTKDEFLRSLRHLQSFVENDPAKEEVLRALRHLHSWGENLLDEETLHPGQDHYEAVWESHRIVAAHFSVGYENTQPPSYGEGMISLSTVKILLAWSREEKRRTTYRRYMIACKDETKGLKHTEELEAFLQTLIPHDKISEMHRLENAKGQTVGWAGVFLDEKGRSEADNHPDLEKSCLGFRWVPYTAENFKMKECA